MIETERLILRHWRDEDAEPFHRMGQDPRVMEFLGPLMTLADAEHLVAGQIVNQALFGHCFWPIERRSDRLLLGFCGLQKGPAGTPIEDGLEIGWRLAQHAWGQGYAREAAEASLAWGWANTAAPEILAMTTIGNIKSWGLMERLGMTRDHASDFDHPAVAVDDPLRPHILYRIARP